MEYDKRVPARGRVTFGGFALDQQATFPAYTSNVQVDQVLAWWDGALVSDFSLGCPADGLNLRATARAMRRWYRRARRSDRRWAGRARHSVFVVYLYAGPADAEPLAAIDVCRGRVQRWPRPLW